MKKISLQIIIVISLYLFAADYTYAQLATGFTKGCLRGTVAVCPPRSRPLPPDEEDLRHCAGLQMATDGVSAPPRGSDTIYIFACKGNSEGAMNKGCTSGNAENDAMLNITTPTRESIGGVVPGNPFMTTVDALGFMKDGAVVEPKWVYGGSKFVVTHKFYWIQTPTYTTLESLVPTAAAETGTNVETGSVGGQQNGEIIFDWLAQADPVAAITGTASNKTCNTIRWDPRGFVIDASTLLPVANVSVTLSKKGENGTYSDVHSVDLEVENPYVTHQKSGQFNFYVPSGIYKLRINNDAIIAERSNVNPAYKQLFDDPEETKLYQKDMEISEAVGKVEVRHIPVVMRGNFQLIRNVYTVMEDQEVKEGRMHLTGLVSHPRTKILAHVTYLDEDGKTVYKDYSFITDALGEYGTETSKPESNPYIDQSMIDENGKNLLMQNIDVSYELNPFYTTGVVAKSVPPSLFTKIFAIFNNKIAVQAQTKPRIAYSVKPIPTYIEGIAYDEKGVPIPNAIVAVYAFFTDVIPMYTTVADGSGKFSIGSQHLPQMEFTLKYKKQDDSVVVTKPDQFIKQNISYFKENKVAPFAMKKSSPAADNMNEVKVASMVTKKDLQVMAKTPSNGNSTLRNGSSGGQTAGREEAQAQEAKKTVGSQNMAIVLAVVFLFVLIGVAVVVAFQMKKKALSP